MADIEHAIAAFQHLHAVVNLHRSSVCGIFPVDGRQKLHCDHASCMIVVLVAERLYQRVTVCFIDVTWRVNWIRYLIKSHVAFLATRKVEIQKVHLYVLFNTIRGRLVAPRGLLY